MNLSPAVKELLSLHEIFRRLGFPSKDLYVDMFGRCSNPTCAVKHVQFSLRRGGALTDPLFRVNIYEDCEKVWEDWPAAIEWWNANADQPAVAEIYKDSAALRYSIDLLLTLEEKGLVHQGKAVQETH